MNYDAWIAAYKSRTKVLFGACKPATREMVEAFPELRRVAGAVLTLEWGRREHWWCEAPDGTIVDPTAEQFPGGVSEYIPWRPGDEVRVGRCMECGEQIYARCEALGEPIRGVDTSFCDDACRAAFADAVMG